MQFRKPFPGMNHLAHFFLAPADDQARAGTLLGDFVRGADLSGYAPRVALGIRLHRRIDAIVDASPQVAALRTLVEPPLRRYAGILLDVFFDHALIQNWPDVSDSPREQYREDIYASLARTEHAMPAIAREVSARMRLHDALASCASHAGVARTLERIALRLKRPAPLRDGIATLARHEDEIRAAFLSLLPHLQQASATFSNGRIPVAQQDAHAPQAD